MTCPLHLGALQDAVCHLVHVRCLWGTSRANGTDRGNRRAVNGVTAVCTFCLLLLSSTDLSDNADVCGKFPVSTNWLRTGVIRGSLFPWTKYFRKRQQEWNARHLTARC